MVAIDSPDVPVGVEEFKRGLRQWASGVTIVTARSGDRVHGMTVSAFSSVSARPPLVLICADKTSDTHGVIAEGGNFAANVLARGQEALSSRFASAVQEDRRFDGLECGRGVTGAPFIPGAALVLDCRVVGAHDSGDHVIYVGEVLEMHCDEQSPLVYFDGRYRTLAD